jgi:hypothetical protein
VIRNQGKERRGVQVIDRISSTIALIFLMAFTSCQGYVSRSDSVTGTPLGVPAATIQNGAQNTITASPSQQPTRKIYAGMPTRRGAELPAPGSVVTSTQHGVTVTLTQLELSSTQTTLEFVVALDPVWGFTFDEFENPAQDAFPIGSPAIVDETGYGYQVREFHGGAGPGRYVDSKTGIAYTSGRFVFESLNASRLEIAIPLILFTVRASEPIRFTVANPDRTQSLAIEKPLIFGELPVKVLSAEWKREGGFELTVDGSVQEQNLKPVCLYLYQDPDFPPPDYKGCFIDERTNIDLSEALTFNPLPDFTKPVEVLVAANIIFLEPFRFTWIRNE